MKKYYKKFFLLFFLVLFLFAGCKKQKQIDYSDKYVFGQDSQENFIRYQNQLYFADSGDSYYYLNSNNGFLYVIDKLSHKCQPLCGKSDCMHDKETSFQKKMDCTAFLNTFFNCVIYYNDCIYFQAVENKVDKDGIEYELNEICSVSLDGSSRKVVYSTRDYAIWNFKMHRGYIYFEGSKKSDEGTAEGSNMALYKVSLDGNDEATELFPYYKYDIQKSMIVNDTRFYGNHIFLWITKLNGTNEKSYLVNYDLQKNEYQNLSDKLKVNINSMFTVYNNKLIFANSSKIYECDFNGENQTQILDCADVLDGYKYYTPFTNDGESLIISAANDDNESDKLIFCDESYKANIKNMPFEFTAEIGCDINGFIDYNVNENVLYFIDKSNVANAKQIYTFESND